LVDTELGDLKLTEIADGLFVFHLLTLLVVQTGNVMMISE